LITDNLSRQRKYLTFPKNPAAGLRLNRTNQDTAWHLLIIIALICGLVPVVSATAPGASFTANQTSGDKPLSVQFIDTSTNTPTSWFWSFGDGVSSLDSDPAHTYTKAGTYTVTLTVTNADGSDTSSKSNYITCTASNASPLASFTSTGATGSKPLTVKFIDTSTETPTSWAWSFGDGGTSTEQNPSHTYAKKGTYTVTMTATNSGGSATITKDSYITVSEEAVAPSASFTATTTAGTIPFTVKFIDTSSNSPTSWLWTFGDGYSAIIQNPTHTYAQQGDYTVTMTATNSQGSSTATKPDYIIAEMAIPIASFNADITSGTAPLVVQFNDTSNNSPTSWSWYFGDEGSSTVQNPLHVFTSKGSYTIVLTVKNSEGSNSTSRAKYINVSALVSPSASFSVDRSSGPDPLTVHFTDTSVNKPTSWQWTFGDGSTSTEQDPVHTYYSAGTYTVVLTASNSQGSDTYTSAGRITVTGITTPPTATPVVTEEVLTLAPTNVPEETQAPASSGTGSPAASSGWLIPALVIVVVVVVIVILILRRRPPMGHGSRGRDL
jgi:PKD repeat protein